MTEGTWNQIISTLGAIILGIVAAKGSGHATQAETASAATPAAAPPPALEELSRTVIAMATHMAEQDATLKTQQAAIQRGDAERAEMRDELADLKRERGRLQEQITREHAENRAYFQDLTASIRRGDPIPDPPESWADDGGLQ